MLRGIITRKIKARKSRGNMTPELQKIYDKAYKGETVRRDKARNEAKMNAVKIRARADAARASTPKGRRVVGSIVTAAKAINTKLVGFGSRRRASSMRISDCGLRISDCDSSTLQPPSVELHVDA